MDCHDVEETTRRLLKDIEHYTMPPELCPCNGHQALAVQQAAERVLAPTAKDDDLLWLVLLSRTVEQFAQERWMWWPVSGQRSNRAPPVTGKGVPHGRSPSPPFTVRA